MLTKTLNPPWLDRSIFPFQSRSLDLDGHLVHYIDEGQGPVLLLLHGNATYSFLYRHIIGKLSSRFRCIALDYPGFGLSTARDGYGFTPKEHSDVVEKFVEALQLKDIRLMVQDWGGPIGLGLAGRRPDLFHSLFIGNTFAWPAQDTKQMRRFSKFMGGPVGRFLTLFLNVFPTALLRSGITRKLTKAERAAYRGPFPTVKSRKPLLIFAQQILKSREYLAEVEAGLIRLREKPVLLLWADQDAGFKESERQRFLQHFPLAKSQMLPGAKHYIQECAPDTISAAILAFEQ
jgi:haloalkane dehalogenase